jgi:hypothetical protein
VIFRISIDEGSCVSVLSCSSTEWAVIVCLLSPSSRPILLPLAICGNCLTGRHVHRRPLHLPNAAVSFCISVDSFCLDVIVVVCLFYNFFPYLTTLAIPPNPCPSIAFFLRLVFAVLYSHTRMETFSSFDLRPSSGSIICKQLCRQIQKLDWTR